MENLLKLLPAISTFIAGPAGTLAGAGVEWLAGRLGAKESTVESIKQTLSGMTPDQMIAIKKLDIEFQEFCLDNGIKLDLAQIQVNIEEAKSESLFKSGGRPACIWIGSAALGYVSILEPIMRFIAQVIFSYKGGFPVIDTSITMQVLFGLLGLGAMRSYDKKQGADK